MVLNDNIRPAITIQNGRNKQTSSTYAFTIDLVPLVLEETWFSRQTFEYNWKTMYKVRSRKRKIEKCNRTKKKCYLHAKTRLSTNVGAT
jgi:hypothetical protein